MARKVDFATSSANSSLNTSVVLDAEDRLLRLAAWKEQKDHKDQRQRVVIKPSSAATATARGKPAAKILGKDAIRDNATKDSARAKAGARRMSREVPKGRDGTKDSARRSRRASRETDAAPLTGSSVQSKTKPLIERLVRDGQTSGALPAALATSGTFASFAGAAAREHYDTTPASPSFPSFASFASRSTASLSLSTTSTPLAKLVLSTSSMTAGQPTTPPLKFAAFGATAKATTTAAAAITTSLVTPAKPAALVPSAFSSTASSKKFAAFGASSAHENTKDDSVCTPASASASRRGRHGGRFLCLSVSLSLLAYTRCAHTHAP